MTAAMGGKSRRLRSRSNRPYSKTIAETRLRLEFSRAAGWYDAFDGCRNKAQTNAVSGEDHAANIRHSLGKFGESPVVFPADFRHNLEQEELSADVREWRARLRSGHLLRFPLTRSTPAGRTATPECGYHFQRPHDARRGFANLVPILAPPHGRHALGKRGQFWDWLIARKGRWIGAKSALSAVL